MRDRYFGIKRACQKLIGRIFALPKLETEEEARAASLLSAILQYFFVGLGLYTILALAAGNLRGLAYIALGLILVVVTLVLLRQGMVYAASLIFAFSAWGGLTSAALVLGGLQSSAFLALMLVILITSALIKGRARFAIIGLTITSTAALYAAEVRQFLPPVPERVPLYDTIVRASIFLMAALLLHRFSRILNEALLRASSNEEAVKSVLSDLVNTTISKSYLDNILRSLSDVLIVLGADLRIERVNQAALDLLDYTEAEMLARTPEHIFTPETFAWLLHAPSGPLRSVETTLRTRSGRLIPVSFSASLLYDSEGHMQGVVCVAQDISERQRTAREIRTREELYRTLARNLPDMGVVLFDRDLGCMVAEGDVLTAAGYSANQIEGYSLLEISPPEVTKRAEAGWHEALAGQHTTIDLPFRNHIYNMQALPVKNESGDIFAGMLLIQDITSIRQAEIELRNHIEQLTLLRRVDDELTRKLDISYTLKLALDLAARISMARAAAILLFDEQERLVIEQVIGRFADGLLDRYPGKPGGLLKQVLEVGLPGSTGNIVALPLISHRRPGGVLLLETETSLTKDMMNFMQVLSLRMAIAVDNARLYQISQKQLTELQSLYDRVSQLEQLKTDMIRMAAHDLRNPINVVAGFADLLIDGGTLGEYEQGQVEHIYRAARHMQKMVSDILSLERIEQIHFGDVQKIVDLAEVAREVFQMHHNTTERVEMHDTIPKTPLPVRGDAPQLREAIANLVVNAIKYTPPGGRVDLQLSQSENTVTLEVIDTGFGIPEEWQSNLFQPFFRVRSKETRRIEGSGLGLHLVKSIVERHNGTLYFHSVYGEGSTFGFRLPLALDHLPMTTTGTRHEPAGETRS